MEEGWWDEPAVDVWLDEMLQWRQIYWSETKMQTGNEEHSNRQRVPKQSGKELSPEDDKLQHVFTRLQVFTLTVTDIEIGSITGYQ